MTNKSNKVGWQPYDLDYYAQELVLEFRNAKDVLNESHKMRMTVAYGLERFWGEHLRLEKDEAKTKKAAYWKRVWDKLNEILKDSGVDLPNDCVKSTLSNKEEKKKKDIHDTQIALQSFQI